MQNFNELKDAIVDYTQRPDVPTELMIKLAENDLRVIRHRNAEKTVTVPLAANVATYTLPADYVEMRVITHNGQRLKPLFAHQVQRAGMEAGFWLNGNVIRLSAPSAAASSLVLTYFSLLPALSNSVQTNWLLDTFPSAYLFAGLKHAFGWARDTEGRDAALAQLGATLGEIEKDQKNGQWGGNTPARLPQ